SEPSRTDQFFGLPTWARLGLFLVQWPAVTAHIGATSVTPQVWPSSRGESGRCNEPGNGDGVWAPAPPRMASAGATVLIIAMAAKAITGSTFRMSQRVSDR